MFLFLSINGAFSTSNLKKNYFLFLEFFSLQTRIISFDKIFTLRPKLIIEVNRTKIRKPLK